VKPKKNTEGGVARGPSSKPRISFSKFVSTPPLNARASGLKEVILDGN